MDAVDVKMVDFRDKDHRKVWLCRVDQIPTGGVLPNNIKAVAKVLLNMSDRIGVSWPSHETISDRADVSVSVVKRALKALREAGVLEWSKRFVRNGWKVVQSSNSYRLILEKSLLGQIGRRVSKQDSIRDRRFRRKAAAVANEARKALTRIIGQPWWSGRAPTQTDPRTPTTHDELIRGLRERGSITW